LCPLFADVGLVKENLPIGNDVAVPSPCMLCMHGPNVGLFGAKKLTKPSFPTSWEEYRQATEVLVAELLASLR